MVGLTVEDCAEIFHEASAFYHRLVLLFRLKDWTRVERDAAHVLALLELGSQHARLRRIVCNSIPGVRTSPASTPSPER